MANKLQNIVEFSGKNYKKEIWKIVLLDLCSAIGCLIIYFFLKSIVYIGILLICTIFLNVFIITSYKSAKDKIIKNRDEEFIQMISYFEIFINNHLTVYQSFKLLIPYASDWMSEEISILLKDIDSDKSVKPFITFARKFKSQIVENVMLSIYQMVDQGESVEQLNQFTIFFSQLSRNYQKSLIDKKERSLSTIDSFPLIGTGAITIIITISILFLMGDIINVF